MFDGGRTTNLSRDAIVYIQLEPRFGRGVLDPAAPNVIEMTCNTRSHLGRRMVAARVRVLSMIS